MRSEETQFSFIGLGIIGFIILVLFLIFAPFTIVGAGERGVVLNFGKVSNTILGEGIHWKTPIVQSVKKISVRVQKNEVKAEAASKDLQTVTTSVVVNWHIAPARVNTVYQEIGGQNDVVDRIIIPAVAEVVKASTAQKNAEEIITKRPELKANIDGSLEKRLNSYHIVLDDVSIVNVDFSREFNAAIEQKQVAEQQAKQAEFIAQKAIKDADARVNKAVGEAKAQQLQQQSLTPELLQKYWIDKWDGHLPATVTGDSSLIQIPIK